MGEIQSLYSGHARRYAPGFSPIAGFADPQRPDFEALRPFCEIGEHFYCIDWSGPVPAGWFMDVDATMYRMVWQGALPEEDAGFDAAPLQPEHALQAVELAPLTRPGPFG